MHELRGAILLLVLCGGMGVSAHTSAALYKWTDANGRLVYSDQAPPGVKVEKMNAPAPGNPDAYKDLMNKDLEFQNRQKSRAEETVKSEKAQVEAKKKSDSCVQVRGRAKFLKEGQRVFRFNEKGDRVFLDEQGRRQAIEENERQLKELNCPS